MLLGISGVLVGVAAVVAALNVAARAYTSLWTGVALLTGEALIC